MAVMYAMPTLTSWRLGTSSGWSTTSGGTNNGTCPDSTTDVVFDANSGVSRTITFDDVAALGIPTCKSLNTTGAAAMTFVDGTTTGVIVNGNVNLTGTTSISTLSTGGTSNLTCTGVPIATLNITTGTTTLLSDLTVTTTFSPSGASFNANGFNVTAPSVSLGSGTLTLGSGTWTMTGSGTVWSITGGTIISGSSTIKLTGSGVTFAGGGKVYNNLWNATSGGASIISGSNTFNNLRINAGRTQKFTASTTTTVTSLTADGTGNPITIDSTTTTAFTLTKAGGGTNYSDYISIAHCSGSPTNTWFARNSTDAGSNTNWTFIPGNSKFLQFC